MQGNPVKLHKIGGTPVDEGSTEGWIMGEKLSHTQTGIQTQNHTLCQKAIPMYDKTKSKAYVAHKIVKRRARLSI